jgi:hypothetical protein
MSIEAMKQAYEVPLVEQLESVPNNARLVIDDADGMGTRYIPVGRMCHDASKALRQAIAEAEKQEPVAWMHTKIDGVAVPHRPSDLDKHPERWEALYKTPPPCPTCEALALTVMLDQTSHDTHPPQRTWVGLTDDDEIPWDGVDAKSFAQAIEAKLKEKNT